MRWMGCLGLLACYSPSPAENIPCGASEACPSGQRCYGGLCMTSAPDDSMPGDSQMPPDGMADAFTFTCSGVDSVLSSPCTNQASEEGFYFDLVAKETIGITGFSIMAQAPGTRSMAIYTRPGTHVGFENNAAGWTMLGSTNNFAPDSAMACPIPPTLVPITFCVGIPKGARAAFYVVMTTGMGSVEAEDKPLGQVVVENEKLQLLAGRQQSGLGAFTGTLQDNRAFQGVIHTSE